MEAAAAAPATSTVEVLACNWITVGVYQRCQLTSYVGMTGVVCAGIAAVEILAALQLCAVARREWELVSAGVQLMGRAAALAINAAAPRSGPQTR